MKIRRFWENGDSSTSSNLGALVNIVGRFNGFIILYSLCEVKFSVHANKIV